MNISKELAASIFYPDDVGSKFLQDVHNAL
jgi:hypothetical protein